MLLDTSMHFLSPVCKYMCACMKCNRRGMCSRLFWSDMVYSHKCDIGPKDEKTSHCEHRSRGIGRVVLEADARTSGMQCILFVSSSLFYFSKIAILPPKLRLSSLGAGTSVRFVCLTGFFRHPRISFVPHLSLLSWDPAAVKLNIE